jgi:hypothetical protein
MHHAPAIPKPSATCVPPWQTLQLLLKPLRDRIGHHNNDHDKGEKL